MVLRWGSARMGKALDLIILPVCCSRALNGWWNVRFWHLADIG